MPSSSHDLRQVPPGLADFSPTANEPDLDVWPLAGDKGARGFDGDTGDLVPVYNSFPEPHIRWLTHAQCRYEFGYSPDNPAETLTEEDLNYIAERNQLTLSKTRMEALRRLARLWNGERVGPHNVHLLADKVPSWDDVFGDLEQKHLEQLRPTVHRHDPDLVEAFGEYSWFEAEPTTPGWVKSTHIARRRADYDLEERARTLINGRDDLPTLRGDPHEGLTHRFGVGCEAVRASSEGRDVGTYVQIGDYTVDLLERDRDRGAVIGEVLTHHHNNELYRSTYHKLANIGRPAILIFDDRSTARRVLNHWQDRCGEVPGAPFNSALNVEWTRRKFREAARDPSSDWLVEDVQTVTMLWDIAFGESPVPTRSFLESLNW